MKDIRELEKLSATDLEKIGADESIPVPKGWTVRLPVRKPRYLIWSVAAAAALLVHMGYEMNKDRQPKDTFDDPYLAYAAVEQALARVSGQVNNAAAKVTESEALIDKVNYWK